MSEKKVKVIKQIVDNSIEINGIKYKFLNTDNWNWYQWERAGKYVSKLIKSINTNIDYDKIKELNITSKEDAIEKMQELMGATNNRNVVLNIMEIDYLPELLACILSETSTFEDEKYLEIVKNLRSMPLKTFKKHITKIKEYIGWLINTFTEVAIDLL
jgi:nucleoside diphosphate kinase